MDFDCFCSSYWTMFEIIHNQYRWNNSCIRARVSKWDFVIKRKNKCFHLSSPIYLSQHSYFIIIRWTKDGKCNHALTSVFFFLSLINIGRKKKWNEQTKRTRCELMVWNGVKRTRHVCVCHLTNIMLTRVYILSIHTTYFITELYTGDCISRRSPCLSTAIHTSLDVYFVLSVYRYMHI